MSAWLEINLARPQQWRQIHLRRSWAIVLVVIVLIAAADWVRHGELVRKIESQENLFQTYKQQQSPPLAKLMPQQIEASRSLQRMLAQLSIPWEELFSSIEASAMEGIQLDSLRPEPEKSKVSIQVSSKDFSALTAFVKALKNQKDLSQAHLVSEIYSDTGPFNWHAVIEVDWKPGSHD